MVLLTEKGPLRFFVDKEFEMTYLSPVQHFVQWKKDNEQWDDYNEWEHASKLVQQIQSEEDIWMDTHLLFKQERLIGVALIVGGSIRKLENKYIIEKEEASLLLKYFHIIEKGKGNGSYWLRSVVFPFYKEKQYKNVYVNSTHPKSFPFYERFGEKIATYEQMSDQLLFKRMGECFLVKL